MNEFNLNIKKPTKSVDDVIKETRQYLESIKKKICRDCKQPKILVQSGRCQECQLKLMEKKEQERQNTKLTHENGAVLVYDENGKLVNEHRYVMEKHLGRKLTKNEVVLHLDGNKQNNDLANLVLAFRSGVPLQNLVCEECGTKGKFKVAETDG